MKVSYQKDINAIDYRDAVYTFLSLDIYKEMDQGDREMFSVSLQSLLRKLQTYDNFKRIHWEIRKKITKKLKEINGSIRDIYTKHGYSYLMSWTNSQDLGIFEEDLIGILSSFKNIKYSKSLDILIPTICRIHEFYYLSHEELQDRKRNLINRMNILSDDPINMRDTKESVYKDPSKFHNYNHIQNVMNYEKDINMYLKEKGLERTVSMKEYKDSIDVISKWIRTLAFQEVNNDRDIRLPVKELFPFAKLYEYSSQMNKILDDARRGILQSNSVKTKDSGSVYNGHERFRQYFQERYGQSRISNIEGNWIIGKSNILPVKELREHNNFVEYVADLDIDFLSIDLGLGDSYKERVVGEPPTIFQSILAPLTKLYKDNIAGKDEYDRDRSLCVATYDIESRMNTISLCSHAVSLDYTGYSDYMARSIYFLMLTMCGFSAENAKFITDVFSMPLKVQGEIFEILFGALQGVEFNFTCITLANIFFSLQAQLIYYFRHENFLSDVSSISQGDDKIIVRFNEEIPRELINLNMELAIMSNCVINPDKTEDSKDTGGYVFCKIRKRTDGSAISGLSGNLMLKKKKFFGDISAIINQLRKVGYNLLPEEENQIIYYLEERLKEDIFQCYKSLSHLTAEECEKLEKLCLKLPIEIGGLDTGNMSTEEYLGITRAALKSALSDSFIYANKKMNRIERFALLGNLMSKDGLYTQYNDLRYQFLIESSFSSGKEVFELLAVCDRLIESEAIDVNALKEYKRKLRKIFDIIFKEMSNSKAISTKDRVDPVKNQDQILIKSLTETEYDDQVQKIINSGEEVYKQIRYIIWSDNNIHADIDLPIYRDITNLMEYYGGYFKPYFYDAFGYRYAALKFYEGRFKGKVMRLSSDNDYYKGASISFLTPDHFDNPSHYFLLKDFFWKKYKDGSLDNYLRREFYKTEKLEKEIKGKILKDVMLSVLEG